MISYCYASQSNTIDSMCHLSEFRYLLAAHADGTWPQTTAPLNLAQVWIQITVAERMKL